MGRWGDGEMGRWGDGRWFLRENPGSGFGNCASRIVGWRNLAIAIAVLLVVVTTNAIAFDDTRFPPLRVHPLPEKLALWNDPQATGDYFDAIASHSTVGYLIWSKFPVSVYIEPPDDGDRRSQSWYNAVEAAVTQWDDYFPLVEVKDRENADILCLRSRPPLRATLNRQTRQLEIPTARTAEASYEFYLSPENPPLLSHRFALRLSPHQTDEQILGAARHELGHALGIWGHSPHPTDALYSTQVNNPPSISTRDINTLKKVYQQPTRLGWAVPDS
ncbi:MAG: peptidase [Cyanobacteriota bacterium]|nr:peptidase [Cyanobacteriota bacterium]